MGKAAVFPHGLRRKVRVARKHPLDHGLVLDDGVGARRVEDLASRREHAVGLLKNGLLELCVIRRPLFLPVLHHRRLCPEHSLPGARGVDQNLVKIPRKMNRQPLRRLRCDEHARPAHALDIFPERPGTARGDIVRIEDAALPAAPALRRLEPCEELRRLSSGGRAQIKNLVSGPNRQIFGRRHRRRVLQVVEPGVIKRTPRGVLSVRHVEPVMDPRNPLKVRQTVFFPERKKSRHGDLHFIDAKTAGGTMEEAIRIQRIVPIK